MLPLPCRTLNTSTFPLDPSFSAFPTYPVVFFLKGLIHPYSPYRSLFTRVTGADQDVVNFTDRVSGSNTIEGLPTFDPRRIVHASQTIEVLKPLPPVSGPGWKLKKRLASIRENSSYHPTHVVHQLIHIFHRVWGHHRVRVLTRGPPRHALRPSLCASIVSFLFPVAHKRHTNSHPVCILQLGWKDHGKALRPQRCLTTPAHTHPSRPRARLGRPRPNVTRAGIDLPPLG